MTRDEFNKLPLLIRSADAMKILGYNDDGLRSLRESNPNLTTVPPGMTRFRWVKSELAKIARLS